MNDLDASIMKLASWQRRLLRGIGLYVVTPYLAVALIFVVCQRRLLFQSTRTGRLLAQTVSSNGSVVEDVEITAESGLIVHGWHFRAESNLENESPLLVIYFPGNAGCREERLADGRDFTRLGCDVLLFDYRGYGDNSGWPSEEGLASDALRIWTYAVNELNFSPNQILIFGESLGGAVAIRLAAELSVAATPPAAIILNSTFDSLANTVAWHYPAFPFRYLLWDGFTSVERVPQITCPILQFHGTADEIVPFERGRQLFAAAAANPQSGIAHRFVTIEGGQHNFITVGMMHEEIKDLLEQLKPQEMP